MNKTSQYWFKWLRPFGLFLIFMLFCAFISTTLLNGPSELVRKETAIVLKGETQGFSTRYRTAQDVTIQVKLANQLIVSINQFEAHYVNKGDKIQVFVWKRRFWGYKYTYKPLR